MDPRSPLALAGLTCAPALVGGGLAFASLGAPLSAGLTLGAGALAAALVFAFSRAEHAELARVASFAEAAASGRGDQVPPQVHGALVDLLAVLERQRQQLQAVAAHAEAVAQRDLSGEVTIEGPLALPLKTAIDDQRQLIGNLSSSSNELEAGTQQILAALRFQEQSAHEQAGAVEETRRTMDSLLEAAEQIARAAEQVHTNAQRTRQSNEVIADRANQLNQLTQKISDALVGINAIADRSDILALNAALEGTKAGEAGKGFILVAEEMRRLAENVVESVREIQQLVTTIREASQASVLATEEGVKLSEETTRSAETIRLTSQQQQSGTRQVTQSMNAVSDLLAQSVAGARECTRATAELNSRAGELRDQLAPYRLSAAE